MNSNHYNDFITKSVSFCRGETLFLEVSEALDVLIEVLKENEIQSIIADILWFIDALLVDSFTEKIKENFISVIRLCEKNIGLNSAFFKDRLSDDILETLKLINSKQQHSARYVKTKTRVFYKQNKFNLIREANEGFSKLIVELVIFDSEPMLMAERIKSLIGYFDLDPNRVIDLILDVFELRLDKSEHFIELLRLLNADKQDLSDLIGHKLIGNNKDTLYNLIVTLVSNDVIELLSIYEHLSPSDEKIKEHYDKDIENAKVKKFNNNFASKLKDDPKALVDEVEELRIEEVDYSDNQKILLCFYFLKAGHWLTAKNLMNLLPPYFTLRYPPHCKLLCDILNALIEPIYSRCIDLPTILKSHRPTKFYDISGSFDLVNYYDDLNKFAFEATNYIGPLISTNHILFVKLIRITQSYFSECKSKFKDFIFVDKTYQGFFNLLRNCLLPSLSMLNSEISLAEELWDAVKYLPYDVRYSLYIYWKDMSNDDHPGLIEEKRSVQSQIRFILKRLSKENVKQIGRQLGKLCHCNPGIVFGDVLNTVLMFSNLSVPVIDTVKYVGSLSLDMLMFSIIESLAGDRVKMEDAQQSQWMQVMSTFVGLLCKRYQFDLVGLFQFILNMIKEGQCSDLIIIKEILHKMTGIDVSEDITDDQMEAMSGGDVLRQEAGYFIQIRNVRKNSSRLKDVLIEHNLAIPYVIMLSQERNLLVHKSSDDHLKVIGRLFDQCHDTMLQMTSFFSLHWSAAEMVNNCPTMSNLFKEYKVDADIAFYLNRSNFNFQVLEKLHSTTPKTNDIPIIEDMELFAATSQEVIEEYVEAITPNFSKEIWDDFNSSFYTTFWLLQRSDLMVPEAAYQRQDVYIKVQMKQIEQDNSISSLKKQKEIDRHNILLEKLRDEAKRGENRVKLVDHWLNSVKGKWFAKNRSGAAKAIVMTRFIELCVFPRVCFSSNDALFVTHIIYKLHRMKTPSFSTLICLDRIFNDITLMISTCSENEAKRYGRFLDAILNIIMKWHSSEEIFNEECVSHPGFVTVFRKNTDGNNKADQLSYENYRHVLHKWHYRITKSVVSCLESDNYVQIRNSLIVLEKVLNNYPKVQQFGQAIERRIEILKEKEKEKRPDIHVLTQSYFGHMIAKKSTWLMDKDFHQKDEARKPTHKPVFANGDKISAEIHQALPKKDANVTQKRLSDNDDKESVGTIDSKRRKFDNNETKERLVKSNITPAYARKHSN